MGVQSTISLATQFLAEWGMALHDAQVHREDTSDASLVGPS